MIRSLTSLTVRCAATAAVVIGAHTALATAPAKPEQEQVKQQLMQLERDMCTAAINGDVATHSAILAEDMTDVSMSGRMMKSRAQNDADLASTKVTVCKDEDLYVRIFGDAAVVVGTASVQMTGFTGRLRFTDTFIRRDGRWRVVASQSTEIKP